MLQYIKLLNFINKGVYISIIISEDQVVICRLFICFLKACFGSFLKQDAVGAYIWASMYDACVQLFLYIREV